MTNQSLMTSKPSQGVEIFDTLDTCKMGFRFKHMKIF